MIIDIKQEKNGEIITIHAEGFMPLSSINFRTFQQYSLRKKSVKIFKDGTKTKIIEYFIPKYLKEENNK
jgi:hypothetical protein